MRGVVSCRYRSVSGEECLAKDDVGLMRIISICVGCAGSDVEKQASY